ncbi:MAG: histidine phosphatase family protein [Pseudomonadota bacterium]
MSTAGRVFWVRHGPTHAKAMVGWSDIPADLSDTAQIARLNAFLPREAVVISSDLVRAVATADAIAGSRSRLQNDPNLREINFGDWEMQNFETIEDQERLRAFWDEPGLVRAPSGETWNDVVDRVDQSIAKLLAAHPGSDIVAVAHMGAILTQVQKAERVTAYEAFAQRIDNLSVTELVLEGDGWRSVRINHFP